MDPLAFVRYFVDALFTILIFAIIARALISWFPIRPDSPVIVLLDEITEPIMRPLRQIVPRLGMLDITPIVAILLLQMLQSLLNAALLSAG